MTLDALLADLERRAVEAERIGASAPVAQMCRALADELRALDASAAPSGESDRLLTAQEAATILGVTPRYMYVHAATLPFTRRLSRKALRFSEAGLRRWTGRRAA